MPEALALRVERPSRHPRRQPVESSCCRRLAIHAKLIWTPKIQRRGTEKSASHLI
ncbi:hypothetical protein BDW66DRAFT_138306 [Aspergillus desertorum]